MTRLLQAHAAILRDRQPEEAPVSAREDQPFCRRPVNGASAAPCAVALAALGLMSSGCMAHADPGGRAWRELRTERFILVTDLDEDAARDRARELEERGAAVTELYGFLTPRKTAPVRPVIAAMLELA